MNNIIQSKYTEIFPYQSSAEKFLRLSMIGGLSVIMGGLSGISGEASVALLRLSPLVVAADS